VPFIVLAPGGQSGNFWIHPRKRTTEALLDDASEEADLGIIAEEMSVFTSRH